MVIALLIIFAGTVSSGLMLYAIEEDEGPLAAWVANIAGPSGAATLISRAVADHDRGNESEHIDQACEEFREETH